MKILAFQKKKKNVILATDIVIRTEKERWSDHPICFLPHQILPLILKILKNWPGVVSDDAPHFSFFLFGNNVS